MLTRNHFQIKKIGAKGTIGSMIPLSTDFQVGKPYHNKAIQSRATGMIDRGMRHALFSKGQNEKRL